MTYYEKYQTMVDEVTTKAIKGVVPKSCAVEIQKSFDEWKSKTSIADGSMEVKNDCLQM